VCCLVSLLVCVAQHHGGGKVIALFTSLWKVHAILSMLRHVMWHCAATSIVALPPTLSSGRCGGALRCCEVQGGICIMVEGRLLHHSPPSFVWHCAATSIVVLPPTLASRRCGVRCKVAFVVTCGSFVLRDFLQHNQPVVVMGKKGSNQCEQEGSWLWEAWSLEVVCGKIKIKQSRRCCSGGRPEVVLLYKVLGFFMKQSTCGW